MQVKMQIVAEQQTVPLERFRRNGVEVGSRNPGGPRLDGGVEKAANPPMVQ